MDQALARTDRMRYHRAGGAAVYYGRGCPPGALAHGRARACDAGRHRTCAGLVDVRSGRTAGCSGARKQRLSGPSWGLHAACAWFPVGFTLLAVAELGCVGASARIAALAVDATHKAGARVLSADLACALGWRILMHKTQQPEIEARGANGVHRFAITGRSSVIAAPTSSLPLGLPAQSGLSRTVGMACTLKPRQRSGWNADLCSILHS